MYINVTSPTDAQKLSSMLNKGDWLVLYYADWCGHCKDMKPEWHKSIEHLKASNKNIHIGEIESTNIPSLTHKPEISGFPTIKMYNYGKEVGNFDNQPRISQNITKFAMDNSSKHHVTKHHNTSHQMRKSHSHNKPSRKHKTTKHRKSRHSKTQKSMLKNIQTQKQTTKNVFGELIKSFSRIGKEARNDAQLLKQAKLKL
jgi:thioredoxin-like negative regulator of GroEL